MRVSIHFDNYLCCAFDVADMTLDKIHIKPEFNEWSDPMDIFRDEKGDVRAVSFNFNVESVRRKQNDT